MTQLAFITKNHTNPAYGGAFAGARAVAARFGAEVSFGAPAKPDDIPEQDALIRQIIATKPDAIALIPAHETKLTAAIRAVNEAGIPLVSLVGEAREGRWICHVGSDDVAMTRDVGVHVLSRVAPGGVVAVMEGHPDSITTPKRNAGYRQALAQFPSLRLTETVTGWFQTAPAREAALGLLERQPRLDAILVANDLMAMGVLQALAERGRKALVASINGTPEAVQAIGAGRLAASASFNTLAFGALAAEAVLRHLRGERVPAHIDLRAEIIDETNWKGWDRPYEARPLPDWNAVVQKEEGR
jgi:ribose transport system substrate-binding protein